MSRAPTTHEQRGPCPGCGLELTIRVGAQEVLHPEPRCEWVSRLLASLTHCRRHSSQTEPYRAPLG